MRPDEDVLPREQVQVVSMKPWEVALVVPTGEGEPITACMDRRAGEFTIILARDEVRIYSPDDPNPGGIGEPARQMHCPGCAGVEMGWIADDEDAVLACRDCEQAIAQVPVGRLLDQLTSDVVYELSGSEIEWL